jgi:hypothetical protein
MDLSKPALDVDPYLYSLMGKHTPTFENIEETRLVLPDVHLILKAFCASNSPRFRLNEGHEFAIKQYMGVDCRHRLLNPLFSRHVKI